MIVTETFTFGSLPGQYAPGPFIQDSIFKGATLDFGLWNKQPIDETDASICNSRLNLGGTNTFRDGDILFIQVKKTV